MNSKTITTDFLIIGSGAAGLQAALHASRYGEVVLLTKSGLEASSSYWAQGGIAAVLHSDDSFQSHKKDTLNAGRGLCNEAAAEILVQEGAQCVQELIDRGMSFDQTNGSLDLGMEGGHSNRRVLHANGAATGRALIEFLTEQVANQPEIRVFEHAFVFNLLQVEQSCRGAQAYLYEDDLLLSVSAEATILATGGYSGLYQRSTNPHTSTGDGLWLGYDAGAELRDMEFIQFHPTAFYADDGSTFLISEAVRGEGAHLYNEKRERFMEDYPRKELSPRDVVSKEIFQQIRQSTANCVYLDVQHLDVDTIRSHFPNLMRKIEESGIDIENEGIPVAPAAHYCIGGIATNLDAQTSVRELYACGEVAATGVHGANRLASNSLLECLVFGKRAIEHAKDSKGRGSSPADIADSDFCIDHKSEAKFVKLQDKVSEILSRYVGIVRDESGMKKAMAHLNELEKRVPDDPTEYYALRSRGLLQVARGITRSALERRESRGVHTRLDFSQKESVERHTSRRKEMENACRVQT